MDGDLAVDWLVSSASLAAGDLDGDGAAEIVAYGADGSTLAFTYKNQTWSFLWKAPYPAGAPWAPCDAAGSRCSLGWAGASIHDLDDDGAPEVIREGVVFSSAGALLSMQPADFSSYSVGLFPILANLDADANIEMTNGDAIWQWTAPAWVTETYYPNDATTAPGRVAVADFGDYGQSGVPTDPEIAIVRGGAVTLRATTGEIILGPRPLPGAGDGGDPTISDFDGDGLTEIGVAGATAYTMYDIDCGTNPRPRRGVLDGSLRHTSPARCAQPKSHGHDAPRMPRRTSPARVCSTSRPTAARRWSTPTSASCASIKATPVRCCSASIARRALGTRTRSLPTWMATSGPSW